MGLVVVTAFGCAKGDKDDVAGRPTILTEEEKQQAKSDVEATVKEIDAVYDVNKVSGCYDTNDGGSYWKMCLFAAGETVALADTVYGVWFNQNGGGIIEGKVTKEGKLAGEWKTVSGSYGKTVLLFDTTDLGTSFAGTWGYGVSMTNGGKWVGEETDESELTKEKLQELKTQYTEVEEESTDNATDDGYPEDDTATDDTATDDTTDAIVE